MSLLQKHLYILEAARSFLTKQAYLSDLCVEIQQIAAPTNAEQKRAAWVETFFQKLGLEDIFQDEVHNVYARIPGQNATSTPALLVSAHTDTVFPMETDLSIRIDPATHWIHGPAIGDNSAGVAGLVALAELLIQMRASGAAPPVDIWLVANTGEEGLGDLRGMRAAVERLRPQIGASIVLEGMGLGRVVYQGLGSRRYRIAAKAPGGHSWSDFGTASAIHVLTQIAADLTRLKAAPKPRTTFNVGRIWGGRSVNTIAQEAALELDLRSEAAETLENIVSQTLAIVKRYQSKRWTQQGVEVLIEEIGNRPTGAIEANHPLVQAAKAALTASDLDVRRAATMSST
ncbi:MAG: M20/M25/M40 family metallo-hydrolase, partial [Caldilineaceae bacterium]|nr:M20/M25/M40 family metallo-hydrolase [Caldilineaceae bacterium]